MATDTQDPQPGTREHFLRAAQLRRWGTVQNIARVGPDGTPARVFLQEELFGPEAYRPIVAYHYSLV